MIEKVKLLLGDAVVLVVVVGLFPAAIRVANGSFPTCVSSMVKTNRALLIWWASALLFALLAYVLLDLPWRTLRNRMAIVVTVVTLLSAALPNLDFGTLDCSREKRALADIRSIAAVLEDRRSTALVYPFAESVNDVQRYSALPLPRIDPWGMAYSVRSGGIHYILSSRGICGRTPLVVSR